MLNENSMKYNLIKKDKPVRVLYSFPHKLGGSRICDTAWYQVDGLVRAGADVLVYTGVLNKEIQGNVKIKKTLSFGKLRISYKLLGTSRACAVHDYIVSKNLKYLVGKIDIIHAWALGSLQTLIKASELGIPTVLERANAHTRFGYKIVMEECARIGVSLPQKQEHSYNKNVLEKEEMEYKHAYRIICPSEFALKSFLDQGIPREKLVRHFRGVDEKLFFPPKETFHRNKIFQMLFVGVCAVNKGLHFALDAWLKSPAKNNGNFLIAGHFLPEYEKKLSGMLAHPSVKILGHRNDIPDLMRNSDILVLPSLSEGFGRVATEAMACGCVPLVSDACTEICRHMNNSLVHHVGDVDELSNHISMLYRDSCLLNKLRDNCIKTASNITWDAAGIQLLDVYKKILNSM